MSNDHLIGVSFFILYLSLGEGSNKYKAFLNIHIFFGLLNNPQKESVAPLEMNNMSAINNHAAFIEKNLLYTIYSD